MADKDKQTTTTTTAAPMPDVEHAMVGTTDLDGDAEQTPEEDAAKQRVQVNKQTGTVTAGAEPFHIEQQKAEIKRLG